MKTTPHCIAASRPSALGVASASESTTPLPTVNATVLAAQPLRELLRQARADVQTIQAYDPNSPVATTLSTFAERLSRAIRTAASLEHEVAVGEAASMTGYSEEAVRWNIRHGRLPARRIGKHYRIRLSELNALSSTTSAKEAR